MASVVSSGIAFRFSLQSSRENHRSNTEKIHQLFFSMTYPYLLLSISIAGIISNVASLFIFAKQKFRRVFHRLLVILAIYDLAVVILCAMMWALPQIWPSYKANAYPYWSRFLLPLVQIALMSSVYCTIVMSWERYVRICIVSKLVSCTDYFTDGKFKLYLGFIVIFPIVFYIPKFFELQPVNKIVVDQIGITCELFHEHFDEPKNSVYLSENQELKMYQECADMGNDTRDWRSEVMMNVTVNSSIVSVDFTPLRKNAHYYNIYCIGINSLFASLFPFIALMFFNISIALELKSISKKPNFFITYIRRGRQRSPTSEHEIETNRSDTRRKSGEGHKLCVRFSRSHERASSSSSSHSGRNSNEENRNIEQVELDSGIKHGSAEDVASTASLKRGRRMSLANNTRLRRSNSPVCRRRENRLTRISLMIVWLFLFCHVWKLIPTVYELIYSDDDFPVWMFYVKQLSHALIVVNSSLNFLIYVVL